jgi:hypothetical protein
MKPMLDRSGKTVTKLIQFSFEREAIWITVLSFAPLLLGLLFLIAMRIVLYLIA